MNHKSLYYCAFFINRPGNSRLDGMTGCINKQQVSAYVLVRCSWCVESVCRWRDCGDVIRFRCVVWKALVVRTRWFVRVFFPMFVPPKSSACLAEAYIDRLLAGPGNHFWMDGQNSPTNG
jgi:hypothetical protein